MKESDAATIVEQHGIHLDAVGRCDLSWGPAVHAHGPKVAAIDFALIRGKHYKRFIWRKHDFFYFETSRRQRRQRAAFSRDRIEMRPAVFLRWKQQSISRYPMPAVSYVLRI